MSQPTHLYNVPTPPKEPQDKGHQDDSGQMALTAHLKELRKRLAISLIAIGLAFIVTYTFSQQLYIHISRPLMQALPEGQRFVAFTGIVEPFFNYLKVAFFAAFIVASPVVFFQVWAFIAPGLYDKERRVFFPLVLFSLLLFACGFVFAYKVVFPIGFDYLLSFSGPELKPFIAMGTYFSLALRFLMAFGIAFQLPLLILVLARIGIVDVKWLVRFWRYALLISFLAGALLTPPDVFSQVLMGLPLMGLYGLGIVLAMIFGKKKDK